jgi:tetratricopeptide (TPR) repeat protein
MSGVRTVRIGILVLSILALSGPGSVALKAAVPPPEKGDAAYYSATLLLNARKYEAALPAYERFIADYPDHSRATRARFSMGLCHYNLGAYAQAEPLFASVDTTVDSPAYEQSRFYRGDCLLKMKRFDEADAAFKAASDTTIADIRILSLAGLVNSAFLAERWESAVHRTDTLTNAAGSAQSTYTLRPRYECAAALTKLGRNRDAISTLTNLLPLVKEQPMKQAVAFLLGESLRMEQDVTEAAKAYAIAATFTNTPLAIQAQFRRANMLSAAGNSEDAGPAFEAFLQLPGAPPNLLDEAAIAAGRIAYDRGDYNKAQQILRPLSARSPPHPEAVLWHARSLMSGGLNHPATNILQTGIESTASPALRSELFATLASAQIAAGSPADAAQTIMEMIRSNPTWPAAPDVVADIALRLHNTNAMEASYTACAVFAANYPGHSGMDRVRLVQADNALRLGRTNEAIFIYAQLRLTSTNEQCLTTAHARSAELRLSQGITHLASHEFPAAETALRQLVGIRLTPDKEATAQLYLGVALSRQGKWDEAIPLLLRASTADNFPSADQALYELAWCERVRNRAEAARQYYLKLQERFPLSAITDRATLELMEVDGTETTRAVNLDRLTNLLARLPANDRDLRPQAVYRIGMAALASNDESNALDRFALILREYPDLPLTATVACQAGDLLMRQKYYEKAIEHYRTALAAGSRDETAAKAQFEIARCLSALNRHNDALAEFEKVEAHNAFPQWGARARLEMGQLAETAGSLSRAAGCYEELIRRYPQTEEASQAQKRLNALKTSGQTE